MALRGQWIGPAFTGIGGGTTVADESGNGLNGSLAGGKNITTVASTDKPGDAGTASSRSMEFDGTNDRVTLTDISFGGTSPISVMAWVKADTTASDRVAICQSTEVILRQLTGRGASFVLNSFTTNDRAESGSNTVPAAGTWYHFAGIYNGTTIRVYVNGSQVATATPTGTYANVSSQFQIGEQQGGSRWDGKIWDVRIYDSDETANLSTIMAEKDNPPQPTGSTQQAGDWSDTATWGGGIIPDDSIDVTINHAVAIDTTAECANLTINAAALTLEANQTLTVAGNIIKKDFAFTLEQGASLIFDCTAADRKFLFGGETGSTVYTTLFETNGVSGNRVTITKLGSNHCWFDEFSEGAGTGSGKAAMDCEYTDFINIGKSDGSMSIGYNSHNHFRFKNCDFTGCGETMKPSPTAWNSATNDFYFHDCRWSGSTGTYSLYFRGTNVSATGQKEYFRCSFDKLVNFQAVAKVENCIFRQPPNISGSTFVTNKGNMFVAQDNGVAKVSIPGSAGSQNCYWLGDLTNPGNPHCNNNLSPNSVHEGWVFDFPCDKNIDSGECFQNDLAGGVTIRNNLAIPSATDGTAIGNMAHNTSRGAITPWIVEHNTVVGDDCAYIAYTEVDGVDPDNDTPLYSSVKSNLVVDPTGSTACVVYDIYLNWEDIFLPANSVKNGKFGPFQYADPLSGLTLSGYRSHFNSDPGTTDITADPQFLDPTRNFAEWAVHKGAASSGDSLATKTTAAFALVMAAPLLVETDLIPWVREGFQPTNEVYRNAGHDGVTIGAVEMAAPAGGITRLIGGSLIGSPLIGGGLVRA